MSLGVAIVLSTVMTVLIMLVVRGKKTPAVVTAGVFGLVVVSLMVGAYAYSQGQASSRASDRREAMQGVTTATQRAYDVQVAQYAACVTKVGTRADIRSVLFSMVDLSDLFPDAPAAALYTESRRALIDDKYPALDVRNECGNQPDPPTTTTTTVH